MSSSAVVVRTCATCAHERDCPILAQSRGIPVPAGVVMPMPCGGDLWQQRQVGPRYRRLGTPAAPARAAQRAASLDELLP